jgi:hypothetical protein
MLAEKSREDRVRKARVLGSVSSTFNEQLLHPQIPKAPKNTDDLTVFVAFSGSALVKFGEIDP